MYTEDYSRIVVNSNIIQKKQYIDFNHGIGYLPLDVLPLEYRDVRLTNHRSKEQNKQFNKFPFYAKKIITVEEYPNDEC